jgi:PIN domain nuclease of toxin-antitoxin system
MPSVFDSSAVVAYLLQEEGAEDVAAELLDGCISSVNAAEVLAVLVRSGVPLPEAKLALANTDLQVIDFTPAHAVLSAEILSPEFRARCISLGDRACMATSLALNLPVLTADRKWAGLNVPGLRIISVR